ncbi:MAG: hypothetical protein V1722_05820 [Candidatus Micrarchaeota archaeon]
MAFIYETENFIVESFEKPTPHIDRNEGGHIKICPKVRIVNRQALSPKLAIECMRLTLVVGEAMATAMNKRGVDVGRVNYQDMGNWSVNKPDGPYFHIHIYGRAKSAKVQRYNQSMYLPDRKEQPEFYTTFKPLNDGDVAEIRKEIERLFKTKKYSDAEWRLS